MHVVDADLAGFMRICKPVAEPGDGVPAYSQEAWAAKLYPESIAIDTAIGLLRAYRAYNLAFFSAVTDGVAR